MSGGGLSAAPNGQRGLFQTNPNQQQGWQQQAANDLSPMLMYLQTMQSRQPMQPMQSMQTSQPQQTMAQSPAQSIPAPTNGDLAPMQMFQQTQGQAGQQAQSQAPFQAAQGGAVAQGATPAKGGK